MVRVRRASNRAPNEYAKKRREEQKAEEDSLTPNIDFDDLDALLEENAKQDVQQDDERKRGDKKNQNNEDDGHDSDLEAYVRASRENLKKKRPEYRKTIDNQEGLEKKLKEILLNDGKEINWDETLVTTAEAPTVIENYEDDFAREAIFYRQAMACALRSAVKCKEFGILTHRPDDYFAEMMKSDQHMMKVRQKVANQRQKLLATEQRRKQRDMKKFGKLVQHNREQDKLRDKKKLENDVAKWREARKEGSTDDFEVNLDDESSKPKKGAGLKAVKDMIESRKRANRGPEQKGSRKKARTSEGASGNRQLGDHTSYIQTDVLKELQQKRRPMNKKTPKHKPTRHKRR